MARAISYSVYKEGLDEIYEARRTKQAVRFWADRYSPDWGDEGHNPAIYAALQNVASAARELEKALHNMLAEYEHQELDPEAWEFADSRRSA